MTGASVLVSGALDRIKAASRDSPLFLASVRDAIEAVVARDKGADIIDAKEPSRGSLGAVPPTVLAAMRRALGPDALVSATIGDDARSIDDIEAAAGAAIEAGADIVKIGLFAGTAWRAVGPLSRRVPLAAVLLADQDPPLDALESLKRAGFSIVLLDTADKSAGALPDVVPQAAIAAFVRDARQLGLIAGLAGALRVHHIGPLKAFCPHLMGFRGALTALKDRSQTIDAAAVAAIRLELQADGVWSLDPASAPLEA